MSGERELLERCSEVASQLDAGTIEEVARALERLAAPTSAHALREVAAVPSTASARTTVKLLFDCWQQLAPEVPAVALAWALRAMDLTERRVRSESRQALVWTGPVPRGAAVRRTDQALLEVVRAARQRLWIVSFAAYRVPETHAALIEAVQRGVSVTFLFESETESGGRIKGEPARSLPPELARAVDVYHWPMALRSRRQGSAGKEALGVLHAKCALADEDFLLVSSANLTPDALELNMELGVLIRGGPLPRQVYRHFSALVEEGCLLPAPRREAE